MGNYRSSHNRELQLREMPIKVRELHHAVISNDLEAVNKLLLQGVNVNFPWYNPSNKLVKDGVTPLLCAVSLNHIEIVQLLIHAGAYINKCDRNGCTPLFKAAFHARPSLIELLSKAGADVNLADFKGKTPLYICVDNAVAHTTCKIAVLKLISSGAIVDKRDVSGLAPVHTAARWKLCDILRDLLAAGADAELPDRAGRTPLYHCVCSLSTTLYAADLRHQLPCVVQLYHAGADMLNLIEWLLHKGAGVPPALLTEIGSAEFRDWYARNVRLPQSLANQCRKCIQRRLTSAAAVRAAAEPGTTAPSASPLVELVNKLHLPSSIHSFLCRRMFYRDQTNNPIFARTDR